MINIRSEENGSEVVILLEGNMDTNTSSQVMEEITRFIGNKDKVILDLEKLEYVSSAGLRVFVMADQQLIAKGAELEVKNVPGEIMDIFEMTGFDNMLNIVQ